MDESFSVEIVWKHLCEKSAQLFRCIWRDPDSELSDSFAIVQMNSVDMNVLCFL